MKIQKNEKFYGIATSSAIAVAAAAAAATTTAADWFAIYEILLFIAQFLFHNGAAWMFVCTCTFMSV